MGEICALCEGPHATMHHGHPLDETPPPQGYPRLAFCEWCEDWHPPGLHVCTCESGDGLCLVCEELEDTTCA